MLRNPDDHHTQDEPQASCIVGSVSSALVSPFNCPHHPEYSATLSHAWAKLVWLLLAFVAYARPDETFLSIWPPDRTAPSTCKATRQEHSTWPALQTLSHRYWTASLLSLLAALYSFFVILSLTCANATTTTTTTPPHPAALPGCSWLITRVACLSDDFPTASSVYLIASLRGASPRLYCTRLWSGHTSLSQSRWPTGSLSRFFPAKHCIHKHIHHHLTSPC